MTKVRSPSLRRKDRTQPLPHLHQLLQTPEAGWDFLALGAHAAAPIGEADLADIDVAAGIHRDAVRRDELAGVEPGMEVAEPGQQFAHMAVDADPGPAIRPLDIDRHVRPDLADIEPRMVGAGFHTQAGRAVHVVPLTGILAVAVKHLDAMVLAIGAINPPFRAAPD